MALNNAQYESIIKGYERTRDNHRYLLEDRKKEIYASIPEYLELDNSVSTLSVAATRRMLEGDDEALAQVRKQIAEISLAKKNLLTSFGYAADYLDPMYKCNHCKDTGYIVTQTGLKQKCTCFRQQELTILYEQSNIQDMIAKENFSTLSYEYYRGEDLQRFENAVNLCQNFVENFKQDYHNLFFYGTVGTGKSFLSGCVAKELLERGNSVIYFSTIGLFDTLARYSFDSKSKGELQSFYEDLYECDLLIIDDLGTEVTNSFVTSQLFSCLNERHLRKKSTIISTNISLEELRDRYSDRIFSRITSNFELCKLTGPDIRIFKKRTNKS